MEERDRKERGERERQKTKSKREERKRQEREKKKSRIGAKTCLEHVVNFRTKIGRDRLIVR